MTSHHQHSLQKGHGDRDLDLSISPAVWLGLILQTSPRCHVLSSLGQMTSHARTLATAKVSVRPERVLSFTQPFHVLRVLEGVNLFLTMTCRLPLFYFWPFLFSLLPLPVCIPEVLPSWSRWTHQQQMRHLQTAPCLDTGGTQLSEISALTILPFNCFTVICQGYPCKKCIRV